MNESQLRDLLHHLDQTLVLFERHEGKLAAVEISVKSMLTTMRGQVTRQLNRVTQADAQQADAQRRSTQTWAGNGLDDSQAIAGGCA